MHRWIAFAGLMVCSAPAVKTAPPPVAETRLVPDAAPVAPGPPFIFGVVKDKSGAVVQGIDLRVTIGDGKTARDIDSTMSNENGEFSLDIELGDGSLSVEYGATLRERFHAGENRIDVTVDGAEVAKARASYPPRVCPSSKPGTILEGHTTSQQDIDELAHMMLEHPNKYIPDFGLASRGKGDVTVIAEIGHKRRLTTNALPVGFRLGDRSAIQAEANLSRNQIGYVEIGEIWSDGTCATVTAGGDIAVPDDPNVIKMCCCASTRTFEKRDGAWVAVGNVMTTCS